MKKEPGKETEKFAGAEEAISLYNKLLKNVDLQTEEEQIKQQNDIKRKAKELLKVEDISSIYEQLIEQPEYEKDIETETLVKEIILRFGEGQEIEQLVQEQNKAMNTTLFKRVKALLNNKEKFEKDIKKLPDSEGPRALTIIKIINDYLATTFNLLSLQVLNTALQLHKEGKLVIACPENAEAVSDLIAVASSPIHYGFRSAIARGIFEDVYQGWPAADISQSTFLGKAYFKEPVNITTTNEEITALQESMREKVLGLDKHGDLCADVFDIITAKWLSKAQHEHDTVKIRADEFLLARGLKARIWGKGRRGGFEEEQRKAIAEQIEYLDQAWVTVKEMEVIRVTESGKRKKEKWREDKKALVIEGITGQQRLDGSLTAYQWEVKPGGVFAPFLYGPGRQTALLSCKALQYDFYREKWEKRIARYLAWLWRISRGNRKEGLRVETLLEAISMKIDKNRPSRTRDRLHKALDRLKKDEVITTWKEDTSKNLTARRGWWRQWLESKIIITAPKEVMQHYEQIESNRQKQLKGNK